MADQDSGLRVGTDAEGGGCWEVVINGVLHQDRCQAPLRKLIKQHQTQQSHNPSARWAQLEPLEGLEETVDRCEPGWAGMVQDEGGWREG
jgi:hypothetical protein